nr:hypothetical protein [Tanacetum cinerariifolium]
EADIEKGVEADIEKELSDSLFTVLSVLRHSGNENKQVHYSYCKTVLTELKVNVTEA